MKTELRGVVKRFKGNGRKLGYPTANLTTSTDLADGVYFGYTDLDVFKHNPSLIFVGVPTTVGDTERRVEVHLLDIPDKDYYDQDLQVGIEEFHRANKKFDSIDQLIEVMKSDERIARAWFARETTA